MNFVEQIKEKKSSIIVVGLGYVGLPLAIAFAKVASVIGFDISKEKIQLYKSGKDVTNEVGNNEIGKTSAYFTADENELKKGSFYIVSVPTPVKKDKTPDLSPLISATKLVGKYMDSGSVVVFESTVYPGVTEEICIPILEEESGLICGKGFKVGYSPERINPGDKIHNLESITKIVSGIDKETLEIISEIYGLIIKSGVYKAESIKIAEAAKVIENAQRDINIAFMNELSIIFNELKIDTKAVLKAAKTKWNFLDFTPGLVGGHCIGVDPYYLTYKAEEIGYHSQVILSGRNINDNMAKYIVENTIKNLIKADRQIKKARVAILGVTFKENCPDIRNSKVIDIINELSNYDINPMIFDPVANKNDLLKEYNIQTVNWKSIDNLDAVIIAVPHNMFEKINLSELKELYRHDMPVLIDIKGIFDRDEAQKNKYLYWRL